MRIPRLPGTAAIVATALALSAGPSLLGQPAITGGCAADALGPAHDQPGVLCEDFDTDRNGSGSLEWTRLYQGACPADPLLGIPDSTDDILGHSVDGGAMPLGVDGRICSADTAYSEALLTCHVVKTENDWHLHSPFEECDPTYDVGATFSGSGRCGVEMRAHSGFRSMHLGRHLNASNTLFDTYRFRQISAFVMDPVKLGASSALEFWSIMSVCDEHCVPAGPGHTTAGGQVQISLRDPATGEFERWRTLVPSENGYDAIPQTSIILCDFDPGDDQQPPLDETTCSGTSRLWANIGDFYGNDRTCTVDSDRNDPVNQDCGKTTNQTIDPTGCSWISDPACGSFLENGSVGRGVWARTQADLTPYAGREARLRWIFEGGGGWGFGESRSFLEPVSGNSFFAYDQDDGWHIDDIRISDVQELENLPPLADAGPDQSFECAGSAETAVTLDGSASSDPDFGTLVYFWSGPFTEGGGAATTVSPTVTLPLGSSSVSLVVSDCLEISQPDTTNVTVTAQIEGFQHPLAQLVPEGEIVPLPATAFRRGNVLALKLQILCGSAALTDGEVSAPAIVALERVGDPPIDPQTLDLGAGQANDNGLLFRSSAGGIWLYNLSTAQLTAGEWEITILMPDGTRHVGGFALR